MNYTQIAENATELYSELNRAFDKILSKSLKPLPQLPPKELPTYRNPKECPRCHVGRLRKIRSTRYGSYFMGCSRYPQCRYTAGA
jgi:ssDNA-binding Zn-finger/Zn-ribbon topoisomerase 1